MHSLDEARTFGRTRLSFANEAEIDEFVSVLGRYENGELTPDEWRAFRLVRGTYGQRQTGDAQMLRIRIPQGILDGEQLEHSPTWPSSTRAASGTSPRARTSSCISCACTTSSP